MLEYSTASGVAGRRRSGHARPRHARGAGNGRRVDQGARVRTRRRLRRADRDPRAPGDLAGSCANQGYEPPFFYCPNRTGSAYQRYHMEVVDQVGNDSFAPGHGVLPSKARNGGAADRLDDRPEPTGHRDDRLLPTGRHAGGRGSRRPAATERRHVPRRHELGQRVRVRRHVQLAALLRAPDAPERAGGSSSTTWPCAGTTGDPFARGVGLGNPTKKAQRQGFLATCTFPLTNTGQAGTGIFGSDVFRVSASSSSQDWKVTCRMRWPRRPRARRCRSPCTCCGIRSRTTVTRGRP